MIENSYWIVLMPLLSSVFIFFFGRWLPLRGAPLGIFAVGYGLAHSLAIFFSVLSGAKEVEISLSWFRFGIFQTEIGILMDGLTAVMLVVVTLVSLLVQIYSLGYMHNDPRFKRYYSYLSFFTFAMLFLVVANNFLQIFIGWELVGVASYLLIGFWFEKESAANAGKKAFLTTKLGDLGFFIAILMIFSLLGTLNFNQVQGRIQEGLISVQTAGTIGILLFLGAMGKSAQVPLHVWLPDAMEGPTPVSALIHAATMVAAGVYLVARTFFIFTYGAFSLEVIAFLGILTAFLAATMALVATDIKRVLAFSTVSQLGYMMLALGVGARTAAIFHLTTHAFFKALLFLCAGSVIHAVHTNDIREMGGLSKKMMWTFGTFVFGWLAISGVPPLAGFFSKDAILEAVLHAGKPPLFALALFVAFLTAFYMTRLLFLVFVNEPNNLEKFNHAKESPQSMVLPLTLLAVLSFSSGLFFQYGWKMELLVPNLAPASESLSSASLLPHWFVSAASFVIAVTGILFAWLFYRAGILSPQRWAELAGPLYRALVKKYGFDEFYELAFLKPADAFSRALAKFDLNLFDRFGVDGVGVVTIWLARMQNWLDWHVVDPLVDFWATFCQRWGSLFRRIQTGMVQNYLLVFLVGFVLLLFFQFKFADAVAFILNQ